MYWTRNRTGHPRGERCLDQKSCFTDIWHSRWVQTWSWARFRWKQADLFLFWWSFQICHDRRPQQGILHIVPLHDLHDYEAASLLPLQWVWRLRWGPGPSLPLDGNMLRKAQPQVLPCFPHLDRCPCVHYSWNLLSLFLQCNLVDRRIRLGEVKWTAAWRRLGRSWTICHHYRLDPPVLLHLFNLPHEGQYHFQWKSTNSLER